MDKVRINPRPMGGGGKAPVSLKECKNVSRIPAMFRVDPMQFGRLTADQVREWSKHAEDRKLQDEFAKQALKALETICKHDVNIEAYRAQAIALGLKSAAEIDNHILSAVLKDHGHSHHIQKILQTKMQELTKMNAQGRADSELSSTRFQNDLREIRARFQSAMRGERKTHSKNLQGIKLSEIRQERHRQNMDYIQAKDYNPSGRAFGGGGLFGGVRRFLAG